ncbi:MAG: DUF4494 domain-containing protein [Prevotellaceae bacterium]|jgi:hypothetical protein|nr:DUF4494 domain-containing protein [Prevotellaceae bacterium]
MYNWFECKVRYEELDPSGKQAKKTTPYLVDAMSFTEAEKRIIEEMKPYLGGEFTVANIRRVNVNEMFEDPNANDDKNSIWYRCKVNFVTLDEEKAIEKKTATQMYVQASDIKEALENLQGGLKGMMADYEIASITETAIMDVFKYDAKTESDED